MPSVQWVFPYRTEQTAWQIFAVVKRHTRMIVFFWGIRDKEKIIGDWLVRLKYLKGQNKNTLSNETF